MMNNRLAALIVLVFFSGPALAADGPKITYQDHVLPILKNACFNCHNPDKKKGNLDLTSYTAMSAGGGSGKLIEPGDADGSKLFKIVTWAEEPNMPPSGSKLNDKDLAVIRAWIAGGAPENSGSKVVVNKPKVDLSVVAVSGKPTGPVAMPKGLSTEPVIVPRRPGAVLSLATSPWAPVVAIGGQKQIALYHSDSLELFGILPFPEGLPLVLKFSANGSLLLAGGGIGGKSGKVVLFDVATGKRVAEVGEEYDAVTAADLLPDQTQIALGTPLRTVKIYNTADGTVAHTIKKHTDWVQAIACSRDGLRLATGDRAGGLWVWEAKTARETYNLAGHKDAVTDVAFRGDSALLASASLDGTIKLWGMEEGKAIRSITAHSGGVMSVAFTHDGRLVSCGRDNVVKVWGADGTPLKTFEPFADLALKAVFTHDGARVIGGDFSGTIRVCNVADGKQLGELLANPLPASQRLKRLEQQLLERTASVARAQAEAKSAEDTLKAAQADLKATQDAAALRKSIPTKEKAVAAARERLAKALGEVKSATDSRNQAEASLTREKSATTAK